MGNVSENRSIFSKEIKTTFSNIRLVDKVGLWDFIGAKTEEIKDKIYVLIDEINDSNRLPEIIEITLWDIVRLLSKRYSEDLELQKFANDLKSSLLKLGKRETSNKYYPSINDIIPGNLYHLLSAIRKTVNKIVSEIGCPNACSDCFLNALKLSRAVIEKNVFEELLVLLSAEEGLSQDDIPLYWRTDPLNLPDIEERIKLFKNITGKECQLTTNIPKNSSLETLKAIWESNTLIRVSISKKNRNLFSEELKKRIWGDRTQKSFMESDLNEEIKKILGMRGNDKSELVVHMDSELSGLDLPGGDKYSFKDVSLETITTKDGATLTPDGCYLYYAMPQAPLFPEGLWVEKVKEDTEWFFQCSEKEHRYNFLPLRMVNKNGKVEKRDCLIAPQIEGLMLERDQNTPNITFFDFLDDLDDDYPSQIQGVSYYLNIVRNYLLENPEKIKAYTEIHSDNFIKKYGENFNFESFLNDLSKDEKFFCKEDRKYTTWNIWEIGLYFLLSGFDDNIIEKLFDKYPPSNDVFEGYWPSNKFGILN